MIKTTSDILSWLVGSRLNLQLRDDWDLIDYSKSSRSLRGAWGGSDMDHVRSDFRDMYSMRSIDQIYPDHLDSEKKFAYTLSYFKSTLDN